jgi:dUTP pyrophosphatase
MNIDKENKMFINILNKSNNPIPDYAKQYDSGFDFKANLSEDVVIKPFERKLIPTGLHFEIPIFLELQVRPRSGLALKNGITVLNTPGTVDSGYTGEVKIILINLSNEDFIVKNGDKIAQGVFVSVLKPFSFYFNEVDKLEDTERGGNGFGSTGV